MREYKIKLEQVEKFLNKLGYSGPYSYYYDYEKIKTEKANKLLNNHEDLTIISHKTYGEVILNINCSSTKFYLQDDIDDFRDYYDFDDDNLHDEDYYNFEFEEESNSIDYSKEWVKFLKQTLTKQNEKYSKLKSLKQNKTECQKEVLEENNDLIM